MLVDDEKAIRGVLARSLRARGYDVKHASSGTEALDLIGERLNEIDVLVTGGNMLGLRGPALVERLRMRRPRLPVVFISGRYDAGLVASSHTDLLQKPFTPEELASCVEGIIKSSRR